MRADRDHRQRAGRGPVSRADLAAAAVPTTSPGLAQRREEPGGMPSRVDQRVAQARCRHVEQPVVDALVISAPISPVSQ